jgi:hypothetical protein
MRVAMIVLALAGIWLMICDDMPPLLRDYHETATVGEMGAFNGGWPVVACTACKMNSSPFENRPVTIGEHHLGS